MSKNSKQSIDNAGKVIELFGGIRPMAKKIDVAVTTVQGWKKRDVIPAARRSQILKAADKYEIDLSDVLSASSAVGESEKLVKVAGNENTQIEVTQNDSDESGDSDEGAEALSVVEHIAAAIESMPEPEYQDGDDSDEYVSDSGVRDDQSYVSGVQSIPRARDERFVEVEKKAVRKSTWINFSLLLLGLSAVGAFILFGPQKNNENTQRLLSVEGDVAAIQDDVNGLRNDVDGVKSNLDAVQQKQSFFSTMIPKDLDKRIEKIQEQATSARAQFGAAMQSAGEVKQSLSEDVLSENAGTLAQRAQALNQQATKVVDAVRTNDLTALYQRLKASSATPLGQTQMDAAVLALNEFIVSAKSKTQAPVGDDLNPPHEGQEGVSTAAVFDMDSILQTARDKTPVLQQTFEDVPAQDLKAAALLLGMTQFRQSLNRDNMPFEDDLVLLKNLVGEDNPDLSAALERLAPHAAEGVLTPGGLKSEFKALAGDAVVASLKGEDVSITDMASARMNQLMKVEKNGDLVTGTQTQADLAKADKMLEQGDVLGAIKAVEGLNGGALDVMTPWISKAKTTYMAQGVDGFFVRSLKPDILQDVESGAKMIRHKDSGTLILKPKKSTAKQTMDILDDIKKSF